MKAGTRPQPTCYEFKNLNWDTSTVVQNAWNTPLDTTSNPVKIYYLVFEQTNNGATVETVSLEITTNGTAHTTTSAVNSGAKMYVYFDEDGAIQRGTSVRQLLSQELDNSAPLETKSVKIRIRQTTGVDPVSASLEVNMVYGEAE